MVYELGILVCGPGTDPDLRAHWGFMIYRPADDFGDLLHVRLIDFATNRFIFENRSGESIVSHDATGICRITRLSAQQRPWVIQIISCEPMPSDKKDCQDWVFETLISLEIEELVPSGTAETWKSRLGLPTKDLERTAGMTWKRLRN